MFRTIPMSKRDHSTACSHLLQRPFQCIRVQDIGRQLGHLQCDLALQLCTPPGYPEQYQALSQASDAPSRGATSLPCPSNLTLNLEFLATPQEFSHFKGESAVWDERLGHEELKVILFEEYFEEGRWENNLGDFLIFLCLFFFESANEIKFPVETTPVLGLLGHLCIAECVVLVISTSSVARMLCYIDSE